MNNQSWLDSSQPHAKKLFEETVVICSTNAVVIMLQEGHHSHPQAWHQLALLAPDIKLLLAGYNPTFCIRPRIVQSFYVHHQNFVLLSYYGALWIYSHGLNMQIL